MPLATERPGVFRARAWNKSYWYVIDPAAAEGLDTSETAWREHLAATNTPLWRRLLGHSVGWILFIAGLAGLFGVMAAANAAVIGIFVTIGFVVLAAISLGIGASIASGKTATEPSPENVIAVPIRIGDWASDKTTHLDLWELSIHYSRVMELQEASAYLLDKNDEDRPPNAEWALAAVVQPAIETELDFRLAALNIVAARVGYPKPDARTL